MCVCVLYANESSKNNIYLKLFLLENVSNLSNFPYFLKWFFFCLFLPFPPPPHILVDSCLHLNLDISVGGQC